MQEQSTTSPDVSPTQPTEPIKSVAELKKELEKLCFNAGNLHYAIEVTKAQLQQATEQIHTVKLQYDAAVKAEQDATAKKSQTPESKG